MKVSVLVASAVLAVTASSARATVINSAYTPLGGNSWMVDFTITNDGTPASFAGFTIDLPGATSLALIASPITWDSAIFQPDANLIDDGFLDSFAIGAANVLPSGRSIGGFKVSFTYSAGATPGALPFVVNSETFAPLFYGTTTVTVVPESGTALMTLLGLALVGLRTAKLKRAHRSITTEVTA